ncbi:MAG: HigA family addiction module antidote protein [Candidatus Melainabacteria bacterium]|nr:MAG: HigA family addiction module antidote protein [Candidatus Melainabacteria bacterium]
MRNSKVVKLQPIHHGEILRSEFMEPLSLSTIKLAFRMGIPRTRVTSIINGKLGITADTAIRLSKAFNISVEFWKNLQSGYDVDLAEYARPQKNT